MDTVKYVSINKPNGYWKDIENVRREIQENFPMMYESGVMPKSEMLRNAGRHEEK